MDSAKEDMERFHTVLTPFLRGNEQENVVDGILVYLMKEAERKEKEAKEARGIRRLKASEEETEPKRLIETPVSNVTEVINAVVEARNTKTILRVAGSGHSTSDAIFPKEGKTLMLIGDLRKIENLKEVTEDGIQYLYCRVGAGCNLGADPMNPRYSTLENSLCYHVSEHGYGIPELGGIIHQTIGGFIMTGSAGGSLKHSFADVIKEIEFVDGIGDFHVAEPNTDLWCAVGVSMGLFGVITHVTFRLPKLNLITGKETGYEFADSSLGPDENGQSKLKESLEENEYFRVNWFPQRKVQRVQEWSGEQTSMGTIIPYYSVLSNTLAAGMAAFAMSVCDYILQKPEPTDIGYSIIGGLLSPFVAIESKPFCDTFYKTLPMDNFAHVDSIIRVDFTEIWMPIDQCQTVVDKLNELFKDQKAAGNFATEIYGAKESPFWLSMSYGGDMVRVDPYWWAYNRGDLRKYFSYFWDVLLDISGTRLHWGKYLPLPGQTCGTKTFDLAYLRSVYPKMDDWLGKRKDMDPYQVFVTDYWRGIFEIPSLRC